MAARKDQKNPKTAKKAEQSELLWAVGELWDLVEANEPDKIRAKEGYSVPVRNMLAGVCYGRNPDGSAKPPTKEKEVLQREMFKSSLDLHTKVSVNKAANSMKIDDMAMEREAKIQAAEIDEMILEIIDARAKGWNL